MVRMYVVFVFNSIYLDDEEDTDWIQCVCSRWLHEECIDAKDIIHDVYGRELFCLTVLCKLTTLIFIDFLGSLNCAVATD